MTPAEDWEAEPAEPPPEAAPITRPVVRHGKNGTRSMPSSEEAEEHVIACCLLEGDNGLTLARAQSAGITPDSFYFPATRTVFEALLDMSDRGIPASDATLITEMGERLLGGLPWLMQITANVGTTAHAGYFIEKVREKELLRDAIKASTLTVEEAYTLTSGLDEFLQSARHRISTLADASITEATKLARSASELAARRVQFSNKPPEPQTRLFLAGKPIATPGNLTTVTSKAKTGKTTTLSAAGAAIVAASADRHDRDTFKFSAPHNSDQAVIVIDTEQSQYDSWLCYERGLKRAGETTDPKWLMHYSLVGYTPEQIKAAILLALDHGKATHKGVFILILDGVADLVSSVNDEVECNALVVWLRSLSVNYNCPIICVIHSNESVQSGDDGRGHLGKQLIRKAESNLVLRKESDITTITSDKQRKAPITEKDAVSFQWSEELQMHVSCKPPEQKKAGAKKTKFLEDYISIFKNADAAAETFPVLQRRAHAKYPIGRDTFWNLMVEGVGNGQIQVNRANPNEPRYWVKAD